VTERIVSSGTAAGARAWTPADARADPVSHPRVFGLEFRTALLSWGAVGVAIASWPSRMFSRAMSGTVIFLGAFALDRRSGARLLFAIPPSQPVRAMRGANAAVESG